MLSSKLLMACLHGSRLRPSGQAPRRIRSRRDALMADRGIAADADVSVAFLGRRSTRTPRRDRTAHVCSKIPALLILSKNAAATRT
ncbi:hypothetical protein Y032_0201g1752 [Ancylostoma ceylanicum]|uniref:Uncharacterized protein n=1 Tax=Ancylostoma ceylanicum TaxID=53326 RepID=A0A016SNC2_9BILA|nr:hypothetical protein Y032_0201g1752 [Ancylostoma ceylanicum]